LHRNHKLDDNTVIMKRIFFSVVCIFFLCLDGVAQEKRVWSECVANGFIARFPDPDVIRWGNQSNHFSWQAGYMMFAMEHLWRQTNDERYLNYIRKYVDQNVDAEGRVPNFKPTALDNFIPGYACLLMYELTGEARYAMAAETIRRGFDAYPRTEKEMFFHSHSIRQVWVDGVFMGQMFLARYAKTMNHPEDYAEVVRQMKGIVELCGREDGLFCHGYYPGKGPSPEVWSEGMGWLTVLWSDVFDYLPVDQPGREDLMVALKAMCRGLKASQNMESGMWCQVVDKPNEAGNWDETSGTGMFMYLIQNAIHKGYISADEYQHVVDRAYQGIIKKAVMNVDSFVNLTDCSSIGLKKDYQAYVSQPREISTFAAFASFILGTGIVEHDLRFVIPGTFYATDYSQGMILKFVDGKIVWRYDAPLSNDIWVLDNGHLLFTTGTGVLELDEHGEEVWSYQSVCHVFACQRLKNGNTFVGECEKGRFLEVNQKGKVVRTVNILPKGKEANDMAFMRNARALENGHFIAAHYGPKKVVEYDKHGKEVWSYDVPGKPHSVFRLDNGNTMIAVADGDRNPRVIEVTPDKQIVWEVNNKCMADSPFRFMSGMQMLRNGSLLVTNWQGHNKGQVQPHIMIIDRKGHIRGLMKPMNGIQSISSIFVPEEGLH